MTPRLFVTKTGRQFETLLNGDEVLYFRNTTHNEADEYLYLYKALGRLLTTFPRQRPRTEIHQNAGLSKTKFE